MISESEFKAQSDKRAKEFFNQFMEKPETKLLLSLLPPTKEHPEVLETLLRGAFSAGEAAGGASVMLPLLKSLTERKER